LKAVADWFVLQFINFWIRYGFLNPVNRAAKHFEVPGFDSIFEFWRGDITLVAEPPEFSGVKLPPKHYYTGPLIPQDEFALPPEIAAIPRDKPLIYFAMGSSGTPEIVASILESFEGKPYRVIAPVKFLLEELPGRVRVPSNVLVTGWLPAVQVNRMADLAVIHGGIGTVMAAALAGKPVVGVGMQIEQVANLACLERLGFAIRVPKSKNPSRHVQEAIQKLLHDDRAKAKAAAARKKQRNTKRTGSDKAKSAPPRKTSEVEPKAGLARADGRRLAVCCVDLDQFKNVNDTYGHPTGDRLLRLVAQRLRGALGERDFAARIGGDEFAVVLDAAGAPDAIDATAAQIVDALSQPYAIDGIEVTIGASVGVALFPADGASADELTKNADLALYQAKSEGRRRHRFFQQDLQRAALERRELEADLRGALAERQLEVHYQPLVDISGRKVTGFEALLRWRHPTRGMIAPNDFIPIAEANGIDDPMAPANPLMILRGAFNTAWAHCPSSPPSHTKIALAWRSRNGCRARHIAVECIPPFRGNADASVGDFS